MDPRYHQPPGPVPTPAPAGAPSDGSRQFLNMAGGFMGLSGGVLALVVAGVILLCCIGPVALCFLGGIVGAVTPTPTPTP